MADSNASSLVKTTIKKLIKGLSVLVLGFAVLFGVRLGIGYINYPPGDTVIDNYSTPITGSYSYDFQTNDYFQGDVSVKNYASSKKVKTWEAGGQVKTATVDQKYEKIATLSAATKQFDEDEEKLRKTVKDYDALIQYEQNQGMEGNRSLFLTIGVDPEKFDSIILDLRKIGKIQNIQVNKTDKTNEFLDLQAQLATLEKTRQSLIDLKSRSGTIREMVDLENRILEVEEQIQNLGVSLGDFDAENEFCTVKFTLSEYKVTVIPGIKIMQRLKVALKWTIKWYGRIIMGLLFSLFTIWLAYEVLRKLKWLPGWIMARVNKMK